MRVKCDFQASYLILTRLLLKLRYTGLQDYHSSENDSDNVTIVVNDRGGIGNGGIQFFEAHS